MYVLPVSTSDMSMNVSSEADANILPSKLKLSARTGQSNLQTNTILSEATVSIKISKGFFVSVVLSYLVLNLKKIIL